MAGQIADDCRQYVAENAASYDGQPEDEAVAAMAKRFHLHAEKSGWDTLDYHVNVQAIVLDGLRMHRSRI